MTSGGTWSVTTTLSAAYPPAFENCTPYVTSAPGCTAATDADYEMVSVGNTRRTSSLPLSWYAAAATLRATRRSAFCAVSPTGTVYQTVNVPVARAASVTRALSGLAVCTTPAPVMESTARNTAVPCAAATSAYVAPTGPRFSTTNGCA